QEAFVGAAVEGRQVLAATPVEDLSTGVIAGLRGQQAVLDVDDPLPRAGFMEAAEELAVGAAAERVLELVAIAPLLDCRDDRVELEPLEVPESLERLADLAMLDLELAGVGEDLPGGARVIGQRRDPVGTGLDHLEGP